MKSAIQNPKSEIGGPYMTNPCAMVLKNQHPISRIKYRVSRIQFLLTFRRVRYKQHSALFPNQASSFNPPTGKEDLKWSMIAKNPVTLNRWRTGFCVFWPNLVVKGKIAVGMPITRHPPHRSQRALLMHWAPASSIDAHALQWIRVTDKRIR